MSTIATPTTTVLNPQLLGRSENLHRALLERTLAGTGLDYPSWISLKITSVGTPAPREQLVARISTASRIGAEHVEAALGRLVTAGLIDDTGANPVLTPAGTELERGRSAAVAAEVAQVYGAVPAEDLATAGRVLATINAALEAKLASA